MRHHVVKDDFRKEALPHLAVSRSWTTVQPRRLELFLLCLMLDFDVGIGISKYGDILSALCQTRDDEGLGRW